MKPKWFTPHSAGRALTAVRPAVERVRRLYRVLEARRPAAIRSDQAVDPSYYTVVEALLAALAEVGRIGVRIKDPRRGIVDFPARRAGREVALSWALGEPGVVWWHEIDAGPGMRRPLDAEGPWDDPGDSLESVG